MYTACIYRIYLASLVMISLWFGERFYKFQSIQSRYCIDYLGGLKINRQAVIYNGCEEGHCYAVYEAENVGR